jgi:hypothetical protein
MYDYIEIHRLSGGFGSFVNDPFFRKRFAGMNLEKFDISNDSDRQVIDPWAYHVRYRQRGNWSTNRDLSGPGAAASRAAP